MAQWKATVLPGRALTQLTRSLISGAQGSALADVGQAAVAAVPAASSAAAHDRIKMCLMLIL
jgi:hypothetical protein